MQSSAALQGNMRSTGTRPVKQKRAKGILELPFLLLWLLGVSLSPAMAQEFFKGRTITLYAGFTPGGGVDSEMRLVSQYLGRHVPGGPNIQPMNMPGAGGILLGNHLYSIAKPDGLTIGMPGRSGFFLAAAVGDSSARYDIAKFTWLGSSGETNLLFWARKSLGLRSWEDVKASKTPVVVGGLATSSASVVVPMVLAKYENVPLRIISGYTGLSEATLAMERGEIDMIYTAAGTFRPDRIAAGDIVPLLQTFPVEPNLPSLQDIKDPREKALIDLLTAPSRLGAPLLGPPGMPTETTAMLRQAYVSMGDSKDYIEDARRRGLELSTPTSGEDLQRYVTKNLNNIPADIVSEYKSYVGMK